MIRTAVAALALALAAPAAAASNDCNRACLGTKLGQFLDAVIARNPASAPLAATFRETQNAVVTPRGTGIWQSNGGFGAVQRRYFDPVTGNAEFFGLLKEGDAEIITSVRIRVEGQRISEAEWHLGRKRDPGMQGASSAVLYDPAGLAAKPPVDRVVPKAQRLSRDELIAITNSYFDGIVANDPRVVRAHPGCRRVENGVEVTGRPLRLGEESQGFEGKGDCMTGYVGLEIANVAARRYLLVDEEAQVVVASAVFIRKPNAAKRRLFFMELFAIDGGKVRDVHAALHYADPLSPVPNWPPYDGNFPLGPNLVVAN